MYADETLQNFYRNLLADSLLTKCSNAKKSSAFWQNFFLLEIIWKF